MSRELLEHVIEKADAGRDLCSAVAVEIDPTGDPGFLSIAFDRRYPHDILLECRACGGVLLTTSASGFHKSGAGCPKLDPGSAHLTSQFPEKLPTPQFFRSSLPAASDSEETHGSFRQHSVARHDNSLPAQGQPSRGRRGWPGHDGPDGGQVECA